jgi:arsenate reductase (glutaredoxin)
VNWQVFGTRKCPDTRKTERFFKERGIRFQTVDLSQKGMSPGELRTSAARLGGFEVMIDRAGKRYEERGLKHSAPTGARIEKALLDDPLLLRTPIVRCTAGVTLGFEPATWARWLAEAKPPA